jgi:hypothetical protein
MALEAISKILNRHSGLDLESKFPDQNDEYRFRSQRDPSGLSPACRRHGRNDVNGILR